MVDQEKKRACARSREWKRANPLSQVYHGMLTRCYNRNDRCWHRYGGRGIGVCDRWRQSYAAFLEDMGPRPPRHSLERNHNDRDYGPDNCRWATAAEQARNRENTRRYEAFGVTATLAEWARDPRCVVSWRNLVNRVELGWLPEDALTIRRLLPGVKYAGRRRER